MGEWRRLWRKFSRHRFAVISLLVIGGMVILALLAPWIAPYSPLAVDASALTLPPGAVGHWLGTDDVGRDSFSRLLFGARLSLSVGFLAVALSLIVGLPIGLVAGFWGGVFDQLVMRVTDMLLALPNILLAIVLVAILGSGLSNTVLAVSLVALPGVIRIVRGAVLSEREKLYMTAARSFGATPNRLLWRHLLPNCWAPIIVQATLGFSDAILNAAALGFLGLGVEPPTPEWGVMLADARAHLESAWWLVTFPGASILFASLCFNLLGDGLRDALDPRLR